MPRTLSQPGLAAALAQETGLVICECLTVLQGGTAVFRVVNNTEDIMSRGSLFTACGFDAVLPEEKEDGFGSLEVTVNNVDQWLTETLRDAEGDIELLYELVSWTAAGPPPEFDNLEQSIMPLQIKTASITETAVKISCSHRKYLEQSFPAMSFTPSDFPGLF